MLQFIQSAYYDFINLLYPNLCLTCNESILRKEEVICFSCRAKLPYVDLTPARFNNTQSIYRGNIPLAFAVSYLYFSKGGLVQKIIHQIKYKGQKEAARTIGLWFGQQLLQNKFPADEVDLLVEVPLHPTRLKKRGYNQSEWLAQGLAEGLGVTHQNNLLSRTRFEASQTGKGRLDRWENVETVFNVNNAELVAGKRIALVDDVMTTGATLDACASVLLKSGCQSVGYITLAATR